MMKTLFLNPPSTEGFDGGAGARYQARREVRSFWYPTWLAQAAACVPNSRLVDAPARGLGLADVAPLASDYEMAVIHASAPTFRSDVAVAEALKQVNPKLVVGLVGAHVAALPERALAASPALDFVARHEFDHTIAELASGTRREVIDGLSWRSRRGLHHNRDRVPLHDVMDRLPSVIPVYTRDLRVRDYAIGYLKHPYVSFYTGRGCRSKCSFCLWPQTIGGRIYRTRSPEKVAADVALSRMLIPEAREIFFDDDTFTDDRDRAEDIARRLGPQGVAWSCNAKPNVPAETLKVMRDNGLRLLLVGYESGSQHILNGIRKGTRIDAARRFTDECHRLGITIHGTFILGLPGETRQTIRDTMEFARDLDPHSIQVSLAAPYPGTELYAQAREENWLAAEDLVGDDGTQLCALSYAHLPKEEIFEAVGEFYRDFYFRPGKMAEMAGEMLTSWDTARRRLREGVEFLRFLRRRRASAT